MMTIGHSGDGSSFFFSGDGSSFFFGDGSSFFFLVYFLLASICISFIIMLSPVSFFIFSTRLVVSLSTY